MKHLVCMFLVCDDSFKLTLFRSYDERQSTVSKRVGDGVGWRSGVEGEGNLFG